MTTLSSSHQSAPEAKADALVVFAVQGEQQPELLGLDGWSRPSRTFLEQALRSLAFTGKGEEVAKVVGTPKVTAPLVLVVGLGRPEGGPAPEPVRRAAGAAIRSLTGRARVAVVAPSDDVTTIAAVAEGAAFGAYRFDHHRSAAHRDAAASAPVGEVVVLAKGRPRGLKAALDRAATLADAQAWARDLVNTSPNELFPQSFAETVTRRAPKNVKVSVLDDRQLRDGGFGGIVGVGQGSTHPPRIVTMTYAPSGAKAHLAFVGKGITFDSGGLCIKPAGSMITMKCDMGGAAAVAAAVVAVAGLGLPVAVTGYLCLAENMPGADAQRPGDVVTMRDGQTVEIINTDAEGRLVMADGIALAAEDGPDAIVDIATLTGAAMIALGKRTAAVMANDDTLQGDLTAAATAAGESVWPMPITEETRAGMDSLVADIKHTGEREGGAMVAAAFLREFAGQIAPDEARPWGHLDIAGPAYNEGSAHGYTPKGGTGFGVRSLVSFAESRA